MTAERNKRETLTHHTMAAVGGFFGVYAIMLRGGNSGSAATGNLINLAVAGLDGSVGELLIRLGGLACYTVGIVTATLTRYRCRRQGRDFRLWAAAIDALLCPVLALIPETVDPLVALYPMFFATAFHWMAYYLAAGYNASTIFSTNNLRQFAEGLTEYLLTRDSAHLRRARFYGGTLLWFHAGVAIGWGSVRLWGIPGIYACLPLVAAGLAATLWEDRLPAAKAA